MGNKRGHYVGAPGTSESLQGVIPNDVRGLFKYSIGRGRSPPEIGYGDDTSPPGSAGCAQISEESGGEMD